ncbi:hypothetical protein RZN05_10075 [Sphingomonas sp. HF-S4]|uniref:Uncharacterized protein n=1 Tax=Sphingomonas agrestis TaxID=3080540 RepID=A0ABU3Y7I3_9SPHN|nr:hypothetical protein [Sphingomonas sp. HF-S4]MDV3457329.1 hypothetical protein [Sphingomonas sp. HF-S4]
MSRAIPAFSLHLSCAVAALAAVALAPPAQGRMLLVPLAGQDADSVAVWATQAGARIVGRGPLGSLAVDGLRGDLLGPALRNATLVVAAPPAACGGRR